MELNSKRTRLFDRNDALLAGLAGIFAFLLYARTLSPGVLPGDSGEFQVLAYQVGIAHTTGYPVYILLSKLFLSLLPFGEIAFRVNLFSAFMGSLAIALTFLCARLLTKNRLAALLGPLALAVSSTFWSQSIIAEVYSAGAAFLAAVGLALLVWEKTNRRGALFVAGILGGAGMGVHAGLVLAVPAIGVLLLLYAKRRKNIWWPAFAGAFVGVVLFLALFLMVDLHSAPADSFNAIYGPARSAWGLTKADVENPVARMVFLISAGQWGGNLFTDPVHVAPKNLAGYVTGFPKEFSTLSIILMAIGFLVLFARNRRTGCFFATAIITHWIFSFNYDVGDINVFYIPGYFWMAVLASIGADALAVLPDRIPVMRIRRAIQSIAFAVLLGVCVYPVAYPRWNSVRDGKNPFLHTKGYPADGPAEAQYRLIADTVLGFEQNALVLVGWDQLYMYWYAASIGGQRDDLRFVELNPSHKSPELPASTLEFIRANLGTRPVYLDTYLPEVEGAGLRLRPVRIHSVQFFKLELP